MSFVDLMAGDIWSEADILRRTESMIRSAFSVDEEAVLNRKATAAALGEYTLSEAEQAELGRYTLIALSAQAEGAVSRADMALLAEVMAIERGEALLADASAEAAALYAMRNPIEPEGVIEP